MTDANTSAETLDALSDALTAANNGVAEAVHRLETIAGPLQEGPQFTSLDMEDLAGHLVAAARVLRDARRAFVQI